MEAITDRYITEYKPIGYTTKDIVDYVREKYKIDKGEKVGTYGKLDPLARGEMLFTVGEDCKLLKEIHDLNKVYEFELVVGISTDTYEPMGIIREMNTDYDIKQTYDKLNEIINKLNGKELEQEFPVYSAYKIRYNGEVKPLWYWEKMGKIKEIKIPSKKIKIHKIKKISDKVIYLQEYINEVIDDINKVDKSNDFRQDIIIEKWKEYYKREVKLLIIKIEIDVSSGTYVRGIADYIGKIIGIPCHANKITRIKLYK